MKLLVLGLALSLISIAASAQSTAPAKPQAPVEASRSEDSSNGKSQLNREGKSVVLTAQPIGIGPTTIISQGLSAGFFIDRDSLIQVDFTANADDDFEGAWWSTKVRNLSVTWKQFVGNSFYFKGGLEQRWVHETYDFSSSSQYDFKGNSTNLRVALGNQWQFKGFTLGCDWFGLSQPIRHKVTSSSYTSTSNQEDIARYSKDYLEDMTFTAVHFYLGMAF